MAGVTAKPTRAGKPSVACGICGGRALCDSVAKGMDDTEADTVSGLFDRMANWLAGPVAAPTTPVVAPAPPPATAAIDPDDSRLPDTSRPRVARLAALVADIEARARDDAMLVSALTEVRQMRETHLPQLIRSYAEIPAAHRAEIFRETGRSASYNLNAAFDRMIARLEALSASMARNDIDSFADNLRFIEHRYGSDGTPE